MNKTSGGAEIGKAVKVKERGDWVQTERAAHQAWAALIAHKPRAAQLLHVLVSQMREQNAVVVSQAILAKLMGVTDRTVRTALIDLTAGRWIQIVRIGLGKEAAYVINDRVAWAGARDKLCLSMFSATVVADSNDQTEFDDTPLRRIPSIYPGERQLPTGPDEDPPSQPCISGMEPDLPSRMIDPETGETY